MEYFDNNSKSSVAILMATYNGEEHIKTQLDSIIRQRYQDWHLLIRDDCSTDNTREIIQEYCKKDERITLITDTCGRLGQLKNFDVLMKKATNYKYVFFADQDDNWFDNKIDVTLRAFQGSKYELVYTNYLVRKEAEKAGKIAYTHVSSGKNEASRLLVQNWIMGCTVAINNALCELAFNIPEEAINHDNWLANLAAAVGKISYVSETTMEHLIHSKNVTQSTDTKRLKNQITRTMKRFKNRKKIRRSKLIFLNDLEDRIKSLKFQRYSNSIKRIERFKLLLSRPRLTNVYYIKEYGFTGVNLRQTVIYTLLLFI